MATVLPSQIPLEILSYSPVYWTGTKCFDFIKDMHGLIKDNANCQKFKIRIDKEHLLEDNDWNIWPKESSWEKVLEEYIIPLKTKFFGDRRIEPKPDKLFPKDGEPSSIYELFSLSRDKIEHHDKYKADEKQKFGWFEKIESADGNSTWIFNNCFYVNFFAKYFPQLLSYLWWQFRDLQDYMTVKTKDKYYPCIIKNGHADFINPQGPIQRELDNNLNQGQLDMRYTYHHQPSSSVTFEVHMIKGILMDKLVEDCECVKLEFKMEEVSVTWYDMKHNVQDSRSTKIPDSCKNEIMTIYVGKRFSNLDDQNILDSYNNNSARVIIFMDEIHRNADDNNLAISNIAQKIGQKLKTQSVFSPVQWNELRHETRRQIKNNGSICIQGRQIKLTEFCLSESEIDTKFFRSQESNSNANKLIKGEIPVLFSSHKIPEKREYYLERNLVKHVDIDADSVLQYVQSECFLFTNISMICFEILAYKYKTINDRVKLVDKANLNSQLRDGSDHKIFLVEENVRNLEISADEILEHIHCFRYLSNNKFEWIRCLGPKRIEKSPCRYLQESESENQLIEDDEASVNLIAGHAGIGKTLLATNLIHKISNIFKNRVIISLDISELLEEPGILMTDESIKTYIVNLISSNQFENSLLNYIITDKSKLLPISLEIFIDLPNLMEGDEAIESDNIIKVFQALKNLGNIRVWLFSRDHFLDDLLTNDVRAFKIKPFNRTLMIKLISSYCHHKLVGKNNFSTVQLETIILNCLRLPYIGSIASTPCLCKVVAKTLAEKLKSDLSLQLDNRSFLVDILENIGEKMLELYAKLQGYQKDKGKSENSSLRNMRTAMRCSHIFLSLQLIMGKIIAKAFEDKLKTPIDPATNFNSFVLEHGIIYRILPLTFFQEIYAEYLIAWFTLAVLRGKIKNISDKDKSFQQFLLNKLPSFKRDFSNKAFKLVPKYPTILNFLDALCEQDYNGLVKDEIFQSRCLGKELYSPKCKLPQPIHKMSLLVYISSINSYLYILLLMLRTQNYKTELLITAVIQHQYQFLDFLIRNEYIRPDCLKSLANYRDYKFGILHWHILGLYSYSKYPEPDKSFHVEFFQYVLGNNKLEIESKDSMKRTPLLCLVQDLCDMKTLMGNEDVRLKEIRFFVDHLKSNVNVRDKNLNTVLHITYNRAKYIQDANKMKEILEFYKQILVYFMENGCSEETLNSPNCENLTPLLSAFEFFEESLLSLLKCFEKYKANFNVPNKNGNTILHLAIERKLSKIFVRELIFLGADIDMKNKLNKNARVLAEDYKRTEIVTLFENLQTELEEHKIQRQVGLPSCSTILSSSNSNLEKESEIEPNAYSKVEALPPILEFEL